MKRLNESIEKINIIYDKIDETKKELKTKIQNIFTKIRNELNEREDKLLMELDNNFNETYFNENLQKISKKLLNKLNICMEEGRKIDSQFNDEPKLNLIIFNYTNLKKN